MNKMSIPFNQKIRDTFNAYSIEEKLYRENIEAAFSVLNLRPTLGEIDQILCAACEANYRFSSDYLTYSEFALAIMEIVEDKKRQKSKAQQGTVQRMVRGVREKEYDVFLGGSCNPTTWRKDTAIPYLEKEGVIYYNPQVDDWYPELMQIEENAKKNSRIKLYVFDTQTRSLASLVEAAFMVSIGCQLIVVLHYLPESKDIKIAGEILSKQEVKDLNRGRSFLCDILEKIGIPVFDNIEDALECTCDIVKGRLSYNHLLTQRKRSGSHYGNWLLQLRKVFNKYILLSEHRSSVSSSSSEGNEILSPCYDSVAIKPRNASTALQEFLQTNTLPSSTKGGLSYLELIDCNVTFDMFCLLTAEAVFQYNNSLWTWGASLINSFFQYTSSILKSPTREVAIIEEPTNHVFLGGSCGETTWRQDIAIPLLESHNVTYYNPQLESDQWNIRKIAEEETAKDTSKAVLFVISKDSASIGSMTEAAFLMGRGNNVYLVIEELECPEKERPYKMTTLAQKDNRRARSYLRDTAEICKIPIFPTVNEAISAILTDKD